MGFRAQTDSTDTLPPHSTTLTSRQTVWPFVLTDNEDLSFGMV